MTLYELTGQMMTLQQMIEDGEDPDIIADTMEGLEGEIEAKADGYAKVIANLKAEAEAYDAEIKRMQGKKDSIKTNIDRMKKSLEMAMRACGKEKFKTDLFGFSIQKNPPKVVIDDPTIIPWEYMIPQEPKIDTVGIKKFLGEQEGGKATFAHLEQGSSLRIR